MNKWRLAWMFVACAIVASGAALGARVSDVRATLHNFSSAATGTATPTGTVPARTVKATTETQVCVFCHTPHAATPGVTPLWNRKLSTTATYTPYTSSSLDAEAIQGVLSNQANGSSKLCLSCHDGAMAIGNVNVLNGAGSVTTQGTVSITMQAGTDAGGTMPSGSSGNTTGFTRRLGIDLTNDHPISVTYDSTLVSRDGELRTLDVSQKYPAGTGTIIGVRSSGYKPKLPLEPTGASSEGQIQCATCHDPHLREADSAAVDYANPKFLRLNRFQAAAATGTYSQTNDIICLSCHTKSGTGGTSNTSWAYSAHANKQISDSVANLTYTTAAANLREFPVGLPVWQAACLNCHDTHTVSGSRRLLREGTNPGTASPKAGGAGTSAIEETCYQCHDGTTTVLNSVSTVPNIKTDFGLSKHMPISNSTETHDVGGSFDDSGVGSASAICNSTTNVCGKDLLESRANLGVGDLTKRHAECPDCHNPHRVVKFKDFRGNPAGTISGAPDASGTHHHRDTTNHTNIASGVLRGAWGVEPVYAAASNPTSFHSQPSSYTVKRGDPGAGVTADAADTYVTREYQICLKCHSDYGYTDTTNAYPTGTRPNLGAPGTTSGTNYVTQYTNQAKEFQPASGHTGEPQGATGSGADAAYEGGTQYNHRSWHPVIAATGRTIALRGINSGNPWRQPWSNTNQVGAQTMYCSDCHGSESAATDVRPAGNGTDAAPTENGSPWGPHGSTLDFLLKGPWNKNTGNANSTDLCFRCHNPAIYRSTSESGGSTFTSGFTGSFQNMHGLHGNRIGRVIKCVWCHVAVPHGWKNKAFLVNLNDIGPEAGHTGSKEVAISSSSNAYNKGPYYLNAKLKVLTFAKSGSWGEGNCGSAGKTGANRITSDGNGGTTMDAGDDATNKPGTTNTGGSGKNWMTNTCSNPP